MHAWMWIALAVVAIAGFAVVAARRSRAPAAAPESSRPPVVRESISVHRPNTQNVEGLEIQYGDAGIVRSVRVGAMNCEHKELLLTMDEVAWRALPNTQKQEVLTVARCTWAKKMCPEGPDIAYVVVQTERGEVVGRADPSRVQIQ